jgi:protocatechuate 3,4-dioxygenase beta subunit
MVKNDPLITYETGILGQADEGKFPKSTFLERKIMSTKTITKRIALVAASALALGGFAVISAPQASAAPLISAAASGMYDTTNFYQVVGGQATIEIRFETQTVAQVTSTGVGTIVSATPKAGEGLNFETLTAITSTGFQHNKTTVSEDYEDNGDTVTVVLTSAVAGAQVITVTPLAANGSPGTAVTKTITWTASGTLAATSWSAYLMDSTTTAVGATIDSTVPLSYDKGSSATPDQVAIIAAKLKDANGNPVNGALVSVTLSGPGLIEAANAGSSTGVGTAPGSAAPAKRVASVTTDANGWILVALGVDGTAGVSTVTLTAGTVSVSRSVTFTGAAASYSVTGLTTTFKVGANGADVTPYVAGTQTTGLLVKGLDSAGGAAASGTVYASSSNPAVASIANTAGLALAATGVTFVVTGVSVGTATITLRNAATAALSTVTKTFDVEVSTGTAATVTMALDKAEYQPGEPGVLSITLTNAAGRPVADGTYTIFAATTPLTSNLYMQNNASGSNDTFTAGATSVTTVGGVAKYDIYAPSFSGTLNITATTLSATTVTSALATTARGVTVAASATVSGGSADANAALALDAANAATDAANNAYDEAQNATQAASDALAAVTALAAQVKTLIASVKKLTAAVAKLK